RDRVRHGVRCAVAGAISGRARRGRATRRGGGRRLAPGRPRDRGLCRRAGGRLRRARPEPGPDGQGLRPLVRGRPGRGDRRRPGHGAGGCPDVAEVSLEATHRARSDWYPRIADIGPACSSSTTTTTSGRCTTDGWARTGAVAWWSRSALVPAELS